MKNKIKRIFFIGIGGSGMSGIAEVMHNLGFLVSGSDISNSSTVRSLKDIGINIFNKHSSKNINLVDVVVVSTAISKKNPEIKAAFERKIPIIPRAEMLAELMRFKKGIAVAGTHGKTTTTSLIAAILSEGGLDPTYVIGGRLNSMNINAKLGSGNIMVVEADESDASFLHLNPINTIVTNIDNDHLDTYQGDFERLKQTYVDFIHQVPFYEHVFLCIDDHHIKSIVSLISRPIVTYGLSESAEIQAVNLKHEGAQMTFQVLDKKYKKSKFNITINFPGEHYVRNVLASIAIGLEYNVSIKIIQKALFDFKGVARRYQIYENIKYLNKNVMVIDDYGHHPTEIEAVLNATKKGFLGKQINLVFQPHRYTRMRDCFDEFIRVLKIPDNIFMFDIYSAGEDPIGKISTNLIIDKLKKSEAYYLKDFESAKDKIFQQINDDSILIIMGAGSIGKLTQNIIS